MDLRILTSKKGTNVVTTSNLHQALKLPDHEYTRNVSKWLSDFYAFREDVVHWHETAKSSCDPFGDDLYAKYKKSCDEYFYLKHRDETRGVGGLFFDDVNEAGFDDSFAFLRSVGDNFLAAYVPIIERRRDHAYGEQQKQFQLYRRGRYVEFNLLYDRGTLFGLQSGGRTESILMSLPPQVRWQYNWSPEPGIVNFIQTST